MKVLILGEHDGRQLKVGTRQAVTAARRLGDEVDRIMRGADVQARLQREGLTYTTMGPEAFGAFTRAEAARWADVVKASGARAD